MRVGFFLTRYTKFFEELINELASYVEVDSIRVVYWPNDHLPIQTGESSNKVTLITRADFVYSDDFFSQLNLLYVPGWMDKGYFYAAIRAKLANQELVTCLGFDDQWHGTLKQTLGSRIFRNVFRRFFTYAWISGPPQYMYARKFGYSNYDIVYNLLSANFDSPNEPRGLSSKPTLIYVGRLVQVKNLEKFLKIYSKNHSDNFHLKIIGTGVLEKDLKSKYSDGIEWIGYKEPSAVKLEMLKSDFFILPSVSEQWSVAVHEAVQCGLALLTSKNVGANSFFGIEGYNSFQFDPKNDWEINDCLAQISSLKSEDILKMKRASLLLSSRISTEISARSLLSMLFKK